jgi:hypothetical protein
LQTNNITGRLHNFISNGIPLLAGINAPDIPGQHNPFSAIVCTYDETKRSKIKVNRAQLGSHYYKISVTSSQRKRK